MIRRAGRWRLDRSVGSDEGRCRRRCNHIRSPPCGWRRATGRHYHFRQCDRGGRVRSCRRIRARNLRDRRWGRVARDPLHADQVGSRGGAGAVRAVHSAGGERNGCRRDHADAENRQRTQVRDPSNQETPSPTKLLVDGLRPGHTGTGYVDFGLGANSVGDSLTLNVEVPSAGQYTLHFRYANGGNAPRPLALTLNDIASGTLAFANTGPGNDAQWAIWAVETVTVQLDAGMNSVKLAIAATSTTGPNIDALAITEPGETPSFFSPSSPASPRPASPRTAPARCSMSTRLTAMARRSPMR